MPHILSKNDISRVISFDPFHSKRVILNYFWRMILVEVGDKSRGIWSVFKFVVSTTVLKREGNSYEGVLSSHE
jgi:hypothetical protein